MANPATVRAMVEAVNGSVSPLVASLMLDAALAEGSVGLSRCTCPVGWGHVRAVDCQRHGPRTPAHTVEGLE